VAARSVSGSPPIFLKLTVRGKCGGRWEEKEKERELFSAALTVNK
jgi:hypothetical protein